jgi:DNA-directed RNA polymerase specialized sigma24 family protein
MTDRAGNKAGADDKIIQGQTENKVRKMIELLPEDQREGIVMRHYAELSFKEIAGLTNCSINTALGRMRYGLINLRKMMAESKSRYKIPKPLITSLKTKVTALCCLFWFSVLRVFPA